MYKDLPELEMKYFVIKLGNHWNLKELIDELTLIHEDGVIVIRGETLARILVKYQDKSEK